MAAVTPSWLEASHLQAAHSCGSGAGDNRLVEYWCWTSQGRCCCSQVVLAECVWQVADWRVCTPSSLAAACAQFVCAQVLRQGPQRVDHTHHINSRAGLMSFFTGGGESVSDNGLADAQRFFVGRRPYGGRMKHV